MQEETILSSIIKTHNSGIKLIDFLCGRFKYHNKEKWEEVIEKGKVTVNGAPCAPECILKKKDIVSYSVVLQEPPVDTNIRIIHNEGTFLVAFKPGNLPSHADGNFIKNTFIHLVKKKLAGEGYTGYAKLVHRLDRETSGLILVAKEKNANKLLARQFEQGSVEKEYIAVTRGLFSDNTVVVNGDIGSDTDSTISIKKRVVPLGTTGSQSAVTKFEIIEHLAGFTVVRCVPSTGRTNQIRVHLAHIGHSLAGDKLYGRSDEEFLEFVNKSRKGDHNPLPWMDAPRHMLHSSKLIFRHPVTDERISFQCPMPEDMLMFIEKIRV